jgi:hypothetical protein
MDKLAKRLREDAERIDATISPQLDERISASLRASTPEQPPTPRQSGRPWIFWLASSLTGAAAAMALIAVLNLRDETVAPTPAVADGVSSESTGVPIFDLHAEAAVLTSPLSKELEALQSDLKRAEEKVREDIGL